MYGPHSDDYIRARPRRKREPDELESHSSKVGERDRRRERQPSRRKHAGKEPEKGANTNPEAAQTPAVTGFSTAFEAGADYVAFMPSPSSPSTPPPPLPSEPYRPRKGREGDEERTRSNSMRGRDRGSANGMHDMVFDFTDADSNAYQRYTPRKAPWVTKVNWDRCANVSELCALIIFALPVLTCCHVDCIVKWKHF